MINSALKLPRWLLVLSMLMFGTAVSLTPARLFAQDDAPVASESETETEAATESEPAAEEAPAEEPAATADPSAELAYAIDNLLLFICAVLVLFMQAGFAMVEAGFNSAKNAVNILCKNLMDMCIGVLLFWVVGYNLMYPADAANGYFAWGGLGIGNAAPVVDGGSELHTEGLHPQVDFFFQAVFAATAATIVSGAVAGRLKFSAYLIYSAVLTAVIYPVGGFWKWGGGWLDQMGFYDFAGSLVVHACGGFAGLAAAIVLGPRIGRFTSDGRSVPMPGHNLPIAALGVFILLVGWYGFNPGSQLGFATHGNANAVMLIALNTTLAACVGGFVALLVSWGMFKKPDLSMGLNGVLAGLVGITANCDGVTNVEAMIIGAVAGVLVVLAIMTLDKLKIDDPVGAFPVHGVCGVWGGIACALFGDGAYWGEAAEGVVYGNWTAQIVGSIAIPVFAFVAMFVLFSILKGANALRVSPEEETQGLDIGEHGMHAYEGFVMT